MYPDDIDKGLADMEQWLHAWIIGTEDTPGFVRQKLLRSQGSEWLPSLGAVDEKETLQRMLEAVKEMQRLRDEQRRSDRKT